MTTDAKAKKLHRAWALYDWANSAYNLVITSTIFPAYYIAITGSKQDATVSFFGFETSNSALLEYSLAAAYLIIAVMSPVLSGIADVRGNKKAYMRAYCILGALSCAALFFFTKERIELGIIASALAAVGYCGSLVFYNAYLPEIAPPEQQDALSAKGFAYGYIGSVLLQLICFVFVFAGFKDGTLGSRISFLLVGVWWLIFAQISFAGLPKGTPRLQSTGVKPWVAGFAELRKVWQQAKKLPAIMRYLPAFFFYGMGVQTVMLAATIFAGKEVKKLVNGVWVNLDETDLIPAILIIQLVAIAGAAGMARLSKRFGNIRVLLAVVTVWIGICIAAYFTYTNIQFYILAVCVGLVMGGVQSLSRSTYAKLLPHAPGDAPQDTTSFFSLYDVTEKMSIVLGMFIFAFVEDMFSSMRYSILALIVFFVIGAALLFRVHLHLRKQEKSLL